MRLPLVLLLATLLGLTLVPGAPQGADASCVGPSFVDAPTTLRPGRTETVAGEWFHDGCADTQGCTSTVGCTHCTTDDPETPQRDVRLTLHQGGRTWVLDTADATGPGDITWRFALPPGVRPGPARLESNGASARVRIVAGLRA